MKIDLNQLQRWQVLAEPLKRNISDTEPAYKFLRVVGILRFDSEVTHVAIFDLSGQQRYPEIVDAERFVSRLAGRQLIFSDHDPCRPTLRDPRDVSDALLEKRKQRRDSRLAIIKYLERIGFDIFVPEHRSRAIAEVVSGKVDQKSHSEPNIRELLNRWWKFGGDSLAFVSDYSKAGRKSRKAILKTAEETGTKANFGETAWEHRKAKHGGVKIDPLMYRAIVDAIGVTLNDPDRKVAFQAAYRRHGGIPWDIITSDVRIALLKAGLADQLTWRNGTPYEAIKTLPNRDQLRRILKAEFTMPFVVRKIKGHRTFALQNRGFNGDSRDIATRIGCVQIDPFWVDLHAVNDKTLLPLGRIHVYFVVDVYSRAIIGVYVTCADPDFRQAIMALHVAFMKKSEWGKIIDLDISDEDWPMHGRAAEILADGAELAHYASNVLPEVAYTDIANTQPCRGDLKSLVEKAGDLAGVGTLRLMPGYATGPKARMAEDPSKAARISVLMITQRITQWAFRVHNKRCLKGERTDPELIARGVELSPNGLWRDSLEEWGALPVYDAAAHLPRMLERSEAEVTRSGLLLGDVYFDRPKDPVFQELKEGATMSGTTKTIVVHYDRCITKQIYMVAKDPAQPPIVVPRSRISREWDGYTFKEVQDAVEHRAVSGVVTKDAYEHAKLTHRLSVSEDVTQSTDAILSKYQTFSKRNKLAAGIGTEKPRADQLKEQLLNESNHIHLDITINTPKPVVQTQPSQPNPAPVKPSARPAYADY